MVIKIPKKTVLLFLYFFAIAYPEGMASKLEIIYIMDIFRYLIIFSLLFLIVIKNKARMNSLSVIMICLYLIIAISCILNNKTIFKAIVNFLYSCGNCIIFSYYLKYETKIFLLCGSIYFTLITCINTIISFVFPDFYSDIGGTITYLGGDNGTIGFYFLTLLFAYFGTQIYGKRRVGYILIINIVSFSIFSLIRDIATAKVCMILFVILLILFKNKYVSGLNNKGKISLIVLLIANYLVVAVRIQEKIGTFIFKLLNRRVSLSSRSIIWDLFFQKLEGHYWTGFGIGDSEIIHQTGYQYYLDFVNTGNVHNMFLQYLFQGGIFALAFFILLWVVAFSNYDLSSKYCKSDFALIVIILFMVRGIVEVSVKYSCFFAPFLYYAPIIEKKYMCRKEK